MDKNTYDYINIEKKWQDNWFKDKIYLSKKEKKEKFFIHFAYPGVSGYLHVGHMRGFTYCDIIARYKRMNDFNVIFPAGFHASGIPSVGYAKKVERKDEKTIKDLKEYGLKHIEIEKLKDPYNVVNYFGKVYINDYWKKFGFLIDYSRTMSTISKGYKNFIKWQFLKLKEKQLLVQKPHYAPFCPNCGPVAVDKSETDISQGGSSEILEFTTIKFKLENDEILPAATLRPETIFGVTNMWVNPDVNYEKIKVENEIWIISQEAFDKINNQFDNVERTNEKISAKQLIGKKCSVPLTDRKIPILSGPFADPKVATGIVMSVPAHAPYDFIALYESGEKIEPIVIIDVKGFRGNPAKEICEKLNIISQNEKEKLDKATEEIYKKEFHKGYLNEKCGDYAGIKISEIKDSVKDDLISKNLALKLREFSEEVICRCAAKVVIKQIPDQWFIKYSDKDLKDETKNYIKKMNVYPEDYKRELPGIIDWFDDRACIRSGSWLGTEFPFKKGWIIEPISDSTLYPAYYIISRYINEKELNYDDLTEEFFDYVFLNIGKAKKEIWKNVKKDFDYWYPVDINLGGKEHKTVHFPVFLMNHMAVMPEEKRPKGIFTHWWVTQKGKEKISKSKGGVEHIAEAATKYGVDAMRLYYSHIGSPFVDIEWDSENVLKYKKRLNSIYLLIKKIDNIENKEEKNIDNWLVSIQQSTIKKTIDAFENYDLRIATNELFFESQKNLQWYLKRGGGNKKILEEFIKNWIKLMTPITPHLTEELWHRKNDSYVSNEKFPEYDQNRINKEEEIGEYLISEVSNDISEILKVTKIKPKKIIIYTSPKWKKEVYRKAIEMSSEEKINVGILIKELMAKPENKKNAKEISKFVSKLPGEILKLNENDKKRYKININEMKYIKASKEYLKDIFSCKIDVFSSDEKNIYDPANKSRFAIPLRPAIFIE